MPEFKFAGVDSEHKDDEDIFYTIHLGKLPPSRAKSGTFSVNSL